MSALDAPQTRAPTGHGAQIRGEQRMRVRVMVVDCLHRLFSSPLPRREFLVERAEFLALSHTGVEIG